MGRPTRLLGNLGNVNGIRHHETDQDDLPMVKAPWKMNSIAAAPAPQAAAMAVSFSTFQIRPVWTTITAAISEIMDKNSGRRPTRSIRNPSMVSIGQVFMRGLSTYRE